VAERLKALVSKTSMAFHVIVGSNPTLSVDEATARGLSFFVARHRAAGRSRRRRFFDGLVGRPEGLALLGGELEAGVAVVEADAFGFEQFAKSGEQVGVLRVAGEVVQLVRVVLQVEQLGVALVC
jgi:hypothetical protein